MTFFATHHSTSPNPKPCRDEGVQEVLQREEPVSTKGMQAGDPLLSDAQKGAFSSPQDGRLTPRENPGLNVSYLNIIKIMGFNFGGLKL